MCSAGVDEPGDTHEPEAFRSAIRLLLSAVSSPCDLREPHLDKSPGTHLRSDDSSHRRQRIPGEQRALKIDV